jgi:anaerobic ribonucleoside-triphosphate reductase activating protein
MSARNPNRLNVHAMVERSRANGPGERFVIWLQGCPLRCPGCFNPNTHDTGPRMLLTADALARQIVAAAPGLEGLTVSGGEPFAQPRGLRALLAAVRAQVDLSVLLFSGFTLRQILQDEAMAAVLADVDVLIAGRYAARRHHGRQLLGSSNQRIHLLSTRHTHEELRAVPECEVHLAHDGSVIVSGVAAAALARALDEPAPVDH